MTFINITSRPRPRASVRHQEKLKRVRQPRANHHLLAEERLHYHPDPRVGVGFGFDGGVDLKRMIPDVPRCQSGPFRSGPVRKGHPYMLFLALIIVMARLSYR